VVVVGGLLVVVVGRVAVVVGRAVVVVRVVLGRRGVDVVVERPEVSLISQPVVHEVSTSTTVRATPTRVERESVPLGPAVAPLLNQRRDIFRSSTTKLPRNLGVSASPVTPTITSTVASCEVDCAGLRPGRRGQPRCHRTKYPLELDQQTMEEMRHQALSPMQHQSGSRGWGPGDHVDWTRAPWSIGRPPSSVRKSPDHQSGCGPVPLS